MASIRVCVIGAGAAGLCAARHLVVREDITFDVYEQSGNVGGTWVFTEQTHTDEFGLPIHSSMYKNLRTNLPKESMQFPDFSFKETNDSFIHHSEVLEYLHEYASNFSVLEKIQFYSYVKNVEPVHNNTNGRDVKWKVTVQNLKSEETVIKEYDAVFVCNGHYSLPYTPGIPGIEDFKGETLHSHCYRDPEAFVNKTVVVLGAAASGIDIALELSSNTKQIYLSHNLTKKLCGLPENIKQVPGILTASSNSFTFHDDITVTADVLIYCTGYEYNFPFLSEDCNVTINDKRVYPLYKHIIHTEYPTLFFIGIPFTVLPFPMFDIQVQFCLKTIDKSITLPSTEEMNADIEKDLEEKLALKVPYRHAHKLGDLQWKYFDELAETSGICKLSPLYKMLYEDTHKRRANFIQCYKKDRYKIVNCDSYTAEYFKG